MRVVVVGAGIMGLSAAWALRRSGHSVQIFEQGPVPNPAASSVDDHRLIRRPYGRHQGYMRMIDAAFAAWNALWIDLGENCYWRTGTLMVQRRPQGWVADSVAAMRGAGLSLRTLDGDAVAREFPLIETRDLITAYHVAEGGVLLAGRIVERLAHYLGMAGVAIKARTPVTAIDPVHARIMLADGGRVDADLVVVAAGAWLTRLLPAMAARVVPSRQVVAYVEPPEDYAARWVESPMLIDIDADSGGYVVPPVAGTGLKIGDHRFSMQGDPDQQRVADPDQARAVMARVEGLLKDFSRYRLSEARICFYTVAPEERFIVEPIERAWVVSACSGHGFKFAPALALALIDAIAGRRPPAQVARWAAGF